VNLPSRDLQLPAAAAARRTVEHGPKARCRRPWSPQPAVALRAGVPIAEGIMMNGYYGMGSGGVLVWLTSW